MQQELKEAFRLYDKEGDLNLQSFALNHELILSIFYFFQGNG